MLNDNRGALDYIRAISFKPRTVRGSSKWLYWKTTIDGKQCIICFAKNGTIYGIDEEIDPEPPVHPNCRCEILPIKAIVAGEATLMNDEGADWYLVHEGALPDYYISKEDAKLLGWVNWQANLWNVAPDRVIGSDVYENRNGKLPSMPKRIWYEADINYAGGYRGLQRIVYSNDGLIFVTYDHFETFLEIV